MTPPKCAQGRSACNMTFCPIEGARVLGLEEALKPVLLPGKKRDVTEEEQSRRARRGVILMAISNKFGLMVVTTGNKSEMSVGYANALTAT